VTRVRPPRAFGAGGGTGSGSAGAAGSWGGGDGAGAGPGDSKQQLGGVTALAREQGEDLLRAVPPINTEDSDVSPSQVRRLVLLIITGSNPFGRSATFHIGRSPSTRRTPRCVFAQSTCCCQCLQ
jgi:hypothetical protein